MEEHIHYRRILNSFLEILLVSYISPLFLFGH